MRIKKTLKTLLGVGLLCGAGLTVQADLITFNVDMTRFTNSAGAQAGFTNVILGGNFNGWGSSPVLALTNNGAGIWSETFDIAINGDFKYIYNPGGNWEDGANHTFTLTASPQTLPLNPFSAPNLVHPIDPPVFVTNNITFQVDMRVQGQAWINGGGLITVSGGFNGWGNVQTLTNDPTAPYPTNWFYSQTYPAITQLYPPGTQPPGGVITRFKFRANGGWEEPQTINPYGNNDRWWDLTNSVDRVLPLVIYSDATFCDTLSEDTMVTFALHITNGMVAIGGHVFNSALDTIHINGESLLGVWEPWNYLLPTLYPAGNDLYTNTFLIPAGRPRNQKVKYNIVDDALVGGDNENINGADHIQWIRSTNTTYTMAPVEFGPTFNSTRVQARFGNLKAGAPSGGNVPVTWDGCGCVTLQTKSDLGAAWTDLPETDGQNSTNMPNSGIKFFRLYNRPNP